MWITPKFQATVKFQPLWKCWNFTWRYAGRHSRNIYEKWMYIVVFCRKWWDNLSSMLIFHTSYIDIIYTSIIKKHRNCTTLLIICWGLDSSTIHIIHVTNFIEFLPYYGRPIGVLGIITKEVSCFWMILYDAFIHVVGAVVLDYGHTIIKIILSSNPSCEAIEIIQKEF